MVGWVVREEVARSFEFGELEKRGSEVRRVCETGRMVVERMVLEDDEIVGKMVIAGSLFEAIKIVVVGRWVVGKRMVGRWFVGKRVVGRWVVGERVVGRGVVGRRVVGRGVVGRRVVGRGVVGRRVVGRWVVGKRVVGGDDEEF